MPEVKSIKKARQNITIFTALTLSCVTMVIVSWGYTGLTAGTYTATILTGLFAGLLVATYKRVQHLEARISA